MATTQPDALKEHDVGWAPKEGCSPSMAACPYQQAAPVVFSPPPFHRSASSMHSSVSARVKASHLDMAPPQPGVTPVTRPKGPGCSDNGRSQRASVHLISPDDPGKRGLRGTIM